MRRRIINRHVTVQAMRKRLWAWFRASLALGVFIALTSCGPREIVEEPFEPTASHSNYREGLIAMEMDETVVGSAWIDAADRALENAHPVALPFQELAHFEPLRPEAVAYRFAALRGQRVEIQLEIQAAEEGRMFADLFRVVEDDLEAFPQVASYSDELNRLEFEPRRDGHYVLRLQPELLRGGRFTVSIRPFPALSFPVEGHGVEDIWSVFGDPRDGGARRHEGVDVFAPRGTPVLAVAPGVVRNVGLRDRGGRTVSILDEERGLVYYYAHLDEQLISPGVRVEPGDVLGTVGNTGNAVTTPPHLHFGIYERRWNAVDPWNYLFPAPSVPPKIVGSPNILGTQAQVVRSEVSIATPTPDRPVIVAAGDSVIVQGAHRDRYRVLLPETGESGYLPHTAVRPRVVQEGGGETESS